MPSSSTIRFRNARGELVEPAKVSSSDAKNRFGKILERVNEDGGVAITLRNEAKFVVISVETYQRLASAAARSLNTLTDEFDALLNRMQEPGQREAMQRAFSMAPVELGHVARKHGGVVASRQAAAAPSNRARKGATLASQMAVSKLPENVLTKARDVSPMLKRSAAKKAKKRSARG